MSELRTYRTDPHEEIAQAPLFEAEVKSWIAESRSSGAPRIVPYHLSAGTLLRSVCRAMGGSEEHPSERVIRFCGPITRPYVYEWVVEMRGCPADGWL